MMDMTMIRPHTFNNMFLDELNTKKKELDEAVADFINCRNGR